MSEALYSSWIEISRSAYRKNIEFFRERLTPGTELAVVIKANAYGHGMVEIAHFADECGVRVFCVHSIDEALILRKHGFRQRIVVVGPTIKRMASAAIENDIEVLCCDTEYLQNYEKVAESLGKTVNIHLKLETGTNRQGISGQVLINFLEELKKCKNVKLRAVYSHFANIEDTTDHSYARFQIDRFKREISYIREAGFSGFDMHFASSAAAAIYSNTHFNMVRLGIAQYGLWPSKETYLSYIIENGHGPEHILTPVLSWKTVIGQVKTVKAGDYIGYGCSHQMTRDSKIAIIPIGYSDGYDRKLSNQGYVLVHGKRAPILGRIAMNLTTIDVTDIPDVKAEDEVVLIGEQGDQIIRAEQLAGLAGTINYEVVARLSSRIPKVVVD